MHLAIHQQSGTAYQFLMGAAALLLQYKAWQLAEKSQSTAGPHSSKILN